MKIIAITTPKIIDEDAYIIKRLLDIGIDIIHLRKPASEVSECRKLLTSLSAEQRERIIIHDHHELYYDFSLKGIHINSHTPAPPVGYEGFKTRSCHSLEEVARYKDDYDYLFISPIFDSISKIGYRSGFDDEALHRASKCGIIDEKVVALGGVTLDKIAYLRGLNFGGAAMMGAIYDIEAVDNLTDIATYK